MQSNTQSFQPQGENMTNLMDITFENIQGEQKSLKDYQANLFLIVNVASKCGLTPQYEGLEALYREFKDQGLLILGFPANEFLGQEPGTNEEIQSFCQTQFDVSFPVLKKIVVKGKGQHPLYTTLSEALPEAKSNPEGKLLNMLKEKGLLDGEAHDIKWNFEKFLVSGQGKLIARYAPDVEPNHELIINDIRNHL